MLWIDMAERQTSACESEQNQHCVQGECGPEPSPSNKRLPTEKSKSGAEHNHRRKPDDKPNNRGRALGGGARKVTDRHTRMVLQTPNENSSKWGFSWRGEGRLFPEGAFAYFRDRRK